MRALLRRWLGIDELVTEDQLAVVLHMLDELVCMRLDDLEAELRHLEQDPASDPS